MIRLKLYMLYLLESLEVANLTASLRWRHNGRNSVSNHQPRECLLSRLFGRRSKKTSKLRVTGLCAGNSPGTGEFPAQRTSNTENVSIWWRHHASMITNQPTWRLMWWTAPRNQFMKNMTFSHLETELKQIPKFKILFVEESVVILRNVSDIYAFSIISRSWGGTGS